MKYLLSPEEMRKADNSAINEYKIPSIILMENAARSSSEYIRNTIIPEYFSNNKKDFSITIICGVGNNGGDGFALARHLSNYYKINVVWIGDETRMSSETKTNFETLKNLDINIISIINENDINQYNFNADIIVDALIGVGGSENIRGLTTIILKKLKKIQALKIAIDVPTGFNSDTGKYYCDCFEANYTITMYAIKTGMLLGEAKNKCGRILLADLGAPNSIIKTISKNYIIENSDISTIIPKRNRISSKFDYGKVTIIAGSFKYSGAAALCANAAITAGSGLVKLFTPKIHSSLLPEVIVEEIEANSFGSISIKNIELLLEEANKSDSVIIGPGLTDNKETLELVNKLISMIDVNIPVIIDADALKAINSKTILRKNIIITPHTGELSKIVGIDRKEIENNHYEVSRKLANKLNCIIVSKHIPVIISDGIYTYFNTNGNPGMATGGSGDVLSGIIGSLVARHKNPLIASALGVFIHASSGDYYANKYSQDTLTATKLIDCLTYVW